MKTMMLAHLLNPTATVAMINYQHEDLNISLQSTEETTLESETSTTQQDFSSSSSPVWQSQHLDSSPEGLGENRWSGFKICSDNVDKNVRRSI